MGTIIISLVKNTVNDAKNNVRLTDDGTYDVTWLRFGHNKVASEEDGRAIETLSEIRYFLFVLSIYIIIYSFTYHSIHVYVY